MYTDVKGLKMRLGIISAMESEITHLLDGAKYTETEIAGATFYKTQLEGMDAILVVSGIGKTNAGMITTLLCKHFGCERIVFSGVAGGIDDRLNIGDIVISTEAICVDYGFYQDGKLIVYQPGHDPLGKDTKHGYPISPKMRDVITLPDAHGLKCVEGHHPKVVWGKVLTADAFLDCVKKRVYYWDTYHAQAYAMEGASIAQVANRFDVPWVIVRALSDLAGGHASFSFEAFLKSTTYNASVVTRHIVRCIRDAI